MARVNVEDIVFKKRTLALMKRAAILSGPRFTRARILGCLTFIWHDSQEAGQIECSEDEIISYADEVEPDEAPAFLKALKETRFLIPTTTGRVEINGNEKQIASMASWSTGRKKGGEATRRKWKESKERAGKPATSIAGEPATSIQKVGQVAGPLHSIPLHSNSLQDIPPTGDLGNAVASSPEAADKDPRIATAEKLGASIFVPKDNGQDRKRFVSILAVQGAMQDALEQFGLDAIKEFYRQAKAAKQLGRVLFDANRLDEYLTEIKAGRNIFQPKEVEAS